MNSTRRGFGCCFGQAFGIAEQQLGRACLYQQRREPGQRGEQRRRQGRCRVSPGQVVGVDLTDHGGSENRILIGALGHRGTRAGQVHCRGHQCGGRRQRLPAVTHGHEQGDGEPCAGRVAGQRYRSSAHVLAGAEPAPCGQDVVDGGGEGMLGCQAVFREQHPHPAGPSQPGGQLTVAAKRPELVASAVQEQQHPAGVGSRGVEPVGWHPAGGDLRHQHVARHRMEAPPEGEGSAELFQRGRGLTGPGLLPVPEGVDRVLHCLAGHGGSPSAWAGGKPAGNVAGRA
jgi:hypothetical protein